MNLQEVFDQLSSGEFSQLSIGGADAGVLDERNYLKVLGHVNLGLAALYTRFNLKEKMLQFTLNPASDTYQLNLHDLLKITKVVTDGDIEVPLNQGADIYSCFTTSLNTVRVPQVILDQGPDLPDALKTERLTVYYRAGHPKIVPVLGVLNPRTTELELPYSHLQALLFFVASRVHNPIGMGNEFNAGNNYYSRYLAECESLEVAGIQRDTEQQSTRLCRNGWV